MTPPVTLERSFEKPNQCPGKWNIYVFHTTRIVGLAPKCKACVYITYGCTFTHLHTYTHMRTSIQHSISVYNFFIFV